jgi:hypothetical protein
VSYHNILHFIKNYPGFPESKQADRRNKRHIRPYPSHFLARFAKNTQQRQLKNCFVPIVLLKEEICVFHSARLVSDLLLRSNAVWAIFFQWLQMGKSTLPSCYEQMTDACVMILEHFQYSFLPSFFFLCVSCPIFTFFRPHSVEVGVFPFKNVANNSRSFLYPFHSNCK